MGKHSTPCKYVQVIAGAVCVNSVGQARVAVLPAGALLTAGRLESGHGWTCSPASSSGVARPLRPHGAGWGTSPLAGQVASRLAPPVPCSQGLTVGRRCHTALPWSQGGNCTWGKKGVSLHLNAMAGPSLLCYLGQLQGRLPSCVGQRSVALPAKQRAPPTWPLRGAGFTDKKVAVFQSRVSIWVRFAPEKSGEEPRLVFDHLWWAATATISRCARTQAHRHSQTRRGRKPTTWILFCAIQWIINLWNQVCILTYHTFKECSLKKKKRNKYTVTCIRCLSFHVFLELPNFIGVPLCCQSLLFPSITSPPTKGTLETVSGSKKKKNPWIIFWPL